MKPLRRLLYVTAFILSGMLFPVAVVCHLISYVFTGDGDAAFDFFVVTDKILTKINPDK